MKQVTLQFGSGDLAVKDVAPPLLRGGHVLVSVRASLISTGTERAKLLTAKRTLLGKARARPDQVRQVVKKFKQVGLIETVKVVRARLGKDEPLGYSCSGVVIAVGADVDTVRVGDRVACAGAGYANHAEIVVVPKNLCTRIPDAVSFEDAAFVTVGAIALHGVRQSEVGIGEHALVVGLGLLGQLTVQLLSPVCGSVVGTDLAQSLCERALNSGASAAAPPGASLNQLAASATGKRGFDVAIVTAADLTGAAFQAAVDLLRDKGRIVVVGGVGINVPNSIKSSLYERELEIRFARSYGPGRYDESYEEGGNDYPYGYVRWTEQRNLDAVLAQVALGRLKPAALVDHVFGVEHAVEAFDLLDGHHGPVPLAVMLKYDRPVEDRLKPVIVRRQEARGGRLAVAVIGAGNFAQANLLPHLQSSPDVRLVSLSTASGLSADAVASRFRFERVAASIEEVLGDPDVNAVLIATRHDSHAELVCRALESGKDVFVEKPLAVSWEELERVQAAVTSSGRSVLVGFNRRYSESCRLVAAHMHGAGPMSVMYRVNAGELASDSWYASARQGGGRFVGEGGHFLDLMSAIVGASISEVSAEAPTGFASSPRSQSSIQVSVKFADGSVGVLSYLSEGSAHLPKERCEVIGGGRSAVIDDYQKVELFSSSGVVRHRVRDGKGHAKEVEAWIAALRACQPMPIPMEEQFRVTAATLAAVESLGTSGKVVLS